MKQGPVINTRYQSTAQVAKLKRAAKARRWSLNTFVVFAAEQLASETLGTLPVITETKDDPLKATDQLVKATD